MMEEHLQIPLVASQFGALGSLQASTEEEHLQILLEASQYGAADEPSQVPVEPHIHWLKLGIKGCCAHVSPCTLHASTEGEHLHTLLNSSQYGATDDPEHESTVPHLHSPSWHLSPGWSHASKRAEHLQTLFVASHTSPVD